MFAVLEANVAKMMQIERRPAFLCSCLHYYFHSPPLGTKVDGRPIYIQHSSVVVLGFFIH